jgi:hypothetical protein
VLVSTEAQSTGRFHHGTLVGPESVRYRGKYPLSYWSAGTWTYVEGRRPAAPSTAP